MQLLPVLNFHRFVVPMKIPVKIKKCNAPNNFCFLFHLYEHNSVTFYLSNSQTFLNSFTLTKTNYKYSFYPKFNLLRVIQTLTETESSYEFQVFICLCVLVAYASAGFLGGGGGGFGGGSGGGYGGGSSGQKLIRLTMIL